MHNASTMPNAQNPSQSLTKPQAVHSTFFPLSIASTSSLAASIPPINNGVCSSRRNLSLNGLRGVSSET